jgi:hypothetical protein
MYFGCPDRLEKGISLCVELMSPALIFHLMVDGDFGYGLGTG